MQSHSDRAAIQKTLTNNIPNAHLGKWLQNPNTFLLFQAIFFVKFKCYTDIYWIYCYPHNGSALILSLLSEHNT